MPKIWLMAYFLYVFADLRLVFRLYMNCAVLCCGWSSQNSLHTVSLFAIKITFVGAAQCTALPCETSLSSLQERRKIVAVDVAKLR